MKTRVAQYVKSVKKVEMAENFRKINNIVRNQYKTTQNRFLMLCVRFRYKNNTFRLVFNLFQAIFPNFSHQNRLKINENLT